MKKRCRTCGKRLKKDEREFCKTCFGFHEHNYPPYTRKQVLAEYRRFDNEKKRY